MDKRDIVAAGSMGPGAEDAIAFGPVTELRPDVPETDTEAESLGPDENADFWKRQINAAMVFERRFRQEGMHAERLYFGPDDDAGDGDSSDAPKNNTITDLTGLIHSNIEVLKPLVFSETPIPVVQRRWHGDGRSDKTDLMAAEAGQRIAQWLVTTTCLDEALERVRDDWLIPGRGAARVLYRAEFEEQPGVDPLTGQPTVESIKASEEVVPRACEWRRLLLAPAHGWDQMPWIAFEVPMTRSKVEKRFPEKAQAFSYSNKGLKDKSRSFTDDDRENRSLTGAVDTTGDPVANPFDTAIVWEIWNRETKSVIWWSPDCQGVILDKIADPLNLENFFPMPKPLMATTRGDSMTPRPDIAYYEERAKEIDIATRKMREILDVMAVAGLFPGTMADQVKELLKGKNQLIPVESWIALMEKGGTNNIIQWLPLDAMIKCVQALQAMRESAKQAMFEASGISDIMRAQGDPRETASAQNLKGKYAGMRLAVKQRQMAVYARDLLRIMLEVTVEMFDTQRLAEICGLDIPDTEAERAQIIAQAQAEAMQFEQTMQAYTQATQLAQAAAQQAGQPFDPASLPPPPQPPKQEPLPDTSFELVHDRLRNDLTRKITITIETSSTVLADEESDKQARVEFLGAFSTFVQQIMPLIATGQFDMKTAKELLMFGVRGFPKSRTLEGMISQLPDEAPKGEQKEDVQVQVAKIRAQVDIEVEKMRMADKEADRAQELALTGAKMLTDAAHKDIDREDAADSKKEEPGEAPQ